MMGGLHSSSNSQMFIFGGNEEVSVFDPLESLRKRVPHISYAILCVVAQC